MLTKTVFTEADYAKLSIVVERKRKTRTNTRPCPGCNSDLKYKKCCLPKDEEEIDKVKSALIQNRLNKYIVATKKVIKQLNEGNRELTKLLKESIDNVSERDKQIDTLQNEVEGLKLEIMEIRKQKEG